MVNLINNLKTNWLQKFLVRNLDSDSDSSDPDPRYPILIQIRNINSCSQIENFNSIAQIFCFIITKTENTSELERIQCEMERKQYGLDEKLTELTAFMDL